MVIMRRISPKNGMAGTAALSRDAATGKGLPKNGDGRKRKLNLQFGPENSKILKTMTNSGTSTVSTSASSSVNGQTYRGPFAIMTVLFFMWGFMTVFNDILIPRFKEAFTLNYYHAMFVQFAFFGAYFTGSLIYFLISAATGDPIAKIGYKNGVVIGLLISA